MSAAVLLPVVICALGFFRMSLGRAIEAGLFVGIGFQGLVLAVNPPITSIQPVMQYYESMGAGYDVSEIGFAALGAAK